MWKLIVILVVTGAHYVSRGFDPDTFQIENAEQHKNSCRHDTRKLQLRLHIKVNLTYHLPRTMDTRASGYRYTPGIGYHKLHMRALSWNDARKACDAERGYLAVINSDEEAQVLRDLVNSEENSGHPAYVGIHDLFQERDWTTVLGRPLSSTGWAKWSEKWGGQPDNAYGGQDCGALRSDGKLDDFGCSGLQVFICELF